jgi:hypothetical protein
MLLFVVKAEESPFNIEKFENYNGIYFEPVKEIFWYNDVYNLKVTINTKNLVVRVNELSTETVSMLQLINKMNMRKDSPLFSILNSLSETQDEKNN